MNRGVLQSPATKLLRQICRWTRSHSMHTLDAETNFQCSGLRVYSVNFAFAYIDPASYQIVTMDSSTPSSLFQDVGNLKSIKQDLSVFVSVGGW